MELLLAQIADAQRGLPTREGPRVRLRDWREEDRAPFAAMNADPRVYAHLGPTLSRQASDAQMDKLRERAHKLGLGIWAVEEKASGAFVGMVGIWVPEWTAPFLPGVELSWRLSTAFWGRGYATEAARVAVEYGFRELDLPYLHAWTTPRNRPSRAVMERLGMTELGRFDHPRLAEGNPLREHVRYGLAR